MGIKRIALIGYALDEYKDNTDLYSEDMGFYVAKRARENAGVAREDITSVHNSTMDLFDGITISNGILIPAAGGYNRDSVRIQNGCLFAIISAYASIMSGATEIAVVSSADAVDYDHFVVANISTDPFFDQPVGKNHLNSYALFSDMYMKKKKISEEDVVMVASQDYKAGSENPYAQIREGYTAKQIVNAPMLSFPLRKYEVVSARSYGGAAIILTSEERAKEYTDSPIWITGFGMGTNPTSLENMVDMPALRYACDEAYERAGIRDARKELAVAEINDPFAFFNLAAYEALQFCDDGGAVELLRDGLTSLEGEIPVNVSGGTLCTNAPNSGGLFRTVQAAMYLEKNTKKGANKALVHDSDMSIGLAGDSHAVLILEKEA